MEAEELRVNRLNTTAFIAADPVILHLQTRVPTRTPTGGVITTAGPPRLEQIFRFIMQSPAGGSIEQRTQDGTERQVDYVLLGQWDAQIGIGDWWEDGSGDVFEVRGLISMNGYETRAIVEAHGKTLEGG